MKKRAGELRGCIFYRMVHAEGNAIRYYEAMIREMISHESPTEESGHIAHLLEVLEHHKLPKEDVSVINRLKKRGRITLSSLKSVTIDAHAAFGIQLFSVLEKVGYFDDAKPPEETQGSYVWQTAVLTTPTDYGATLLVAVLSELQKSEHRARVKQGIGSLVARLSRQKSLDTDMQSAA